MRSSPALLVVLLAVPFRPVFPVDFNCIDLPDLTSRPPDCDNNPDPSGWCDCLATGLTVDKAGAPASIEQAIVEVRKEPTVGHQLVTVDSGTLDLKKASAGDLIGQLLIDIDIGQPENFFVLLQMKATDTTDQVVSFNIVVADTNDATKAVLGYDPTDAAHAHGLTYRGQVTSGGPGGGFTLEFSYISDPTDLPQDAGSTGLEPGDLTSPGFTVPVKLSFPLIEMFTLPDPGPLQVTTLIEQILTDPSSPVARTFVDSFTLEPSTPRVNFRRGDTNGDRTVDLSDAVYLLSALFLGGPPTKCSDAADANDDGETDITDAIAILGFLFQGGAPLPAPGPEACGPDGKEDPLGSCVYDC